MSPFVFMEKQDAWVVPKPLPDLKGRNPDYLLLSLGKRGGAGRDSGISGLIEEDRAPERQRGLAR
jgi:hypothetical protein